MNRYAFIDQNGLIQCIGVLSGEVSNEIMISVDESFNPSNKRWNGFDWEYYEPEPYHAPEPDKLDLILEEVRKSSADIVSETEAAYEAALNEAYMEGVNSL